MTPGDGVIVTVGNTARGASVEQHSASHLQVASRHHVAWGSPSAKRRVVCSVLALSQIVTSQKKEGERVTRVQRAAPGPSSLWCPEYRVPSVMDESEGGLLSRHSHGPCYNVIMLHGATGATNNNQRDKLTFRQTSS